MRPRHRAAVIALLLACLGAAPPEKKAESKVRSAATKRAQSLVSSLAKHRVSGFVVAGRRAFSSKEAARASKAAAAGGVAIDASSALGDHGGTSWKVISDQGDVVEVRSIVESEQYCHRASALDPVEARAFVRKIDLRPVLVTEQSERFRDGSAISFAPGAALGAPIFARRGGWAVYAEGVTFELKAPDRAIALSYALPKPFSVTKKRFTTKTGPDGEAIEEPWRRVVPRSVLYLDGQAALRADRLPEDMIEAQTSEGASRPQEELLGLASKCVKLKVVGTTEDGTESGGLGVSGARTRWTSRHRIPKGTPLTYPDGSPAGTTLEEVFAGAPTQDKDRLCFELAVAVDSRLCASSSAVIEDK